MNTRTNSSAIVIRMLHLSTTKNEFQNAVCHWCCYHCQWSKPSECSSIGHLYDHMNRPRIENSITQQTLCTYLVYTAHSSLTLIIIGLYYSTLFIRCLTFTNFSISRSGWTLLVGDSKWLLYSYWNKWHWECCQRHINLRNFSSTRYFFIMPTMWHGISCIKTANRKGLLEKTMPAAA